MPTFATFKTGPARGICRSLGLDISGLSTWAEFHRAALKLNNSGEGEEWPLVAAARRADGVLSSGERILLHAVLFAADFAGLADELAGDRTWRRMDNVSGPHLDAVVACLLRQD